MTGFGAQSLALVGGVGGGPAFNNLVAVASGAVQFSVDGVTWAAATGVTALPWRCCAYSPELSRWVMVAFTNVANRIMSSDDGGATWTQRASPITIFWRGVEWSSALGLFTATGSGGAGNDSMNSVDGITWVSGTAPQTTSNSLNVTHIKYTDAITRFYGGKAGGTAGLARSFNGADWSTAPLNPGLSAGIQAAEYIPNTMLFCMFDGINTRVYSSPFAGDIGSPWVQIGAIAGIEVNDMAYSPSLGLLVTVGTGNAIRTSPDGITWTTRVPPTGDNGRAITWSQSLGAFFAATSSATGWTSTDGITWTTFALGLGNCTDIKASV